MRPAPAMTDARTPGGAEPRFFRSRVRTPSRSPVGTPGTDADAANAAAHGYVPPQPPPGTDPRLWCRIHHRPMHMTLPPERRVHCPQCIPSYQSIRANGGRASVRTGLRCARVNCWQMGHYDLWGVPVCSPRCVQLIGEGVGVRPLGVPLRVIAIPGVSGGWTLMAFYASSHSAWWGIKGGTIRIHWWLRGRRFPGATLLRLPPLESIRHARAVRTGCKSGAQLTFEDDDLVAYFLVRFARSETQPFDFAGLVVALMDWRRGRGPRPWIDSTLEPAIRHAERLLERVPSLRRNVPRCFRHADVFRPRYKVPEEGEQHSVRGAMMAPELWGELRGEALRRDAETRRLPLPDEPEASAPRDGLDEDQWQPGADDESAPEPEADTG